MRLAVALVAIGAALAGAGVALVYLPAGLIVLGVELAAAGLFGIDVKGKLVRGRR